MLYTFAMQSVLECLHILYMLKQVISLNYTSQLLDDVKMVDFGKYIWKPFM